MGNPLDIYVPSAMPGDDSVDSLKKYLEDELAAISEHLMETTALDLRPVNAAPKRPRDGMIVYADGTQWNPGAGAGLYVRKAGAWVHIV